MKGPLPICTSIGPSSRWRRHRPAAATGWSDPTAGSSPSGTPASKGLRPERRSRPGGRDRGNTDRSGYWLLAEDQIRAFGDAVDYGHGQRLVGESPRQARDPAVGFTATTQGDGYLVLRAGAYVYAFGGAAYHGVPVYLSYPRVGIAAVPDGDVVADAYGASEIICATSPNSSTFARSNAQVVAIAARPTPKDPLDLRPSSSGIGDARA
jgi:hypothetical protein